VLQTYQELDTSVVNVNAVSAGQQAEWDWSLDPAGTSANSTYYFRVVKSDGNALDTYSVYPKIHIGAPTLNQEAYRWFANANSTDVGSTLAAQNTAATAPAQGTAFRLRTLVHVSTRQLETDMPTVKLQFAARSGTCDTAFAGETYADVATGSGAIRYYNNAAPADGATATSNANDPSAGHTKVMQSYEEANNASVVSAIPAGQDGVWDFALVDFSAGTGSVYCFRIVRADGTPLDTYTTVPQLSISTAPNTPTSLAQKTTGDALLSTGSWHNSQTVRFTATASDTDNPDTLYLCVEKKALGVAFTNTEDGCGTGVAYSGAPVALAVDIASITDATEYHWQARIKDAGGLYSAWASYDVNLESAGDFGIDTTAPSTGTVYDGAGAAVDASFNDGSLSSLSANWAGFSANVSGMSHYEYSIGTTPAAIDIKAWTNNGTTTSVTAGSLTLRTNQLYYVNVRMIDNAGNISAVVSSNGQVVAPTLTSSVGATTITFDRLTTANSHTSTKSLSVTTSTNAYGGYVVRSYATGSMTGANGSIGWFNGGSYASPDTWQVADRGVGYTSSDTLIQGVNKFQAATCPGGTALGAPGCFAPFSTTGPGDIVMDHASGVAGTPITNESFTLTLRIAVDPTHAAGTYGMTIVVATTATY
jgi:hypothetical protein